MDFQESAGARLRNVDWEIEPRTILVSGPAEVLDNMDSIVLDKFVLADMGSATNYSYAIPVPEGCENLSGVTGPPCTSPSRICCAPRWGRPTSSWSTSRRAAM